MNSAATLVLMLLYGTIQDRLDLRRHLTIVISALMALIGPFAIFVYKPLLASNFTLGAALGALFIGAAFVGSTGLFEAFVERLSRRNDFEFGQARMWGSFGYAIDALAAGFLLTTNPDLNSWAGSMLGVVLLLTQLFWRPRRAEKPLARQAAPSIPTLGEMAGLLKMKPLWVVIVFVIVSWTFYTVYEQQMFPDYYTSLFSTRELGQQTYGTLNSAQVFLEAIMMGVVPLVMRKVGVRTTLLLGVSIMFLRITGTALLSDPILVSVVKMFHAFEVPLFVLGIFRYFTLHFRTALSATLYLVGFTIVSQVGNVILSRPLGALHDSIGSQPTFLVIAGVVALAAVFALIFMERDDKQVLGDPFIPGEPAAKA
ncbi:MFS transporter [Brachybacterium huguangmaarense]